MRAWLGSGGGEAGEWASSYGAAMEGQEAAAAAQYVYIFSNLPPCRWQVERRGAGPPVMEAFGVRADSTLSGGSSKKARIILLGICTSE